ncbi:hypothetical protein AALA94_10630, partial [Lactococcus taiwanensis]
VSALGSFAPIAALADVDKSGDTVITYEGAPKPAEWGLSVPAALNLTEDETDANLDKNHAPEVKYNIGTVEIVSVDGTEFADQTSDRVFRVNVTSKYTGGQNNDYMRMANKTDNTQLVPLLVKVSDQGGNFADYQAGSASNITNFNNALVFKSKTDQSNPRMKKDVLFVVNQEAATLINTNNAGLENTLTWTALE